MVSFLAYGKNIPNCDDGKTFQTVGLKKAENIGLKAAAAKRPQFAHG